MRLPHFLLHPQKLLLHCHQLFLPLSGHRCWPVFSLALLCFLGAGLIAPSHTQAQAAAITFPVVHIALSDQSTQLVCAFVAADEATLAQAILCVNSAGPGLHTIQVTDDIALTQPLPALNNLQASQVVIEGNGHTINAHGQGRILSITTTQVTVRNLTLRGGRSLTDDWFAAGGAIQLRGGHSDGGCGLTLSGTTLEDNQAFAGGAIANLCDDSVITITNSLLHNNQATRGGAIFIPTGEELFSELIIDQSQLTDNQAAERGGAILLSAGDAGSNATISNSTIANNRVISGTGGGLSIVTGDEAAITNALLRNVAIISNTATSGGGLEVASRGATIVTVANTTISHNTATGAAGGGLWIQGALEFDSTNVRLINSTVASNTAPVAGGIAKLDGLITLTNTLVAGNSNGDCQWLASSGLPNRVVSGGHNLDSDGGCLPAGIRQSGDIPNGKANVGPLAHNGGPTLTHLLLAGSQAIDAGHDATCAAAPISGVDQRGVARPQGTHCDIGAVETGDGQTLVYTVTKFDDSHDGICDADCSLREAVAAANRHWGRDEIHLASGVYHLTIPALLDDEGDILDDDDNARGDLDITDDLWLTGQGAEATIIESSGAPDNMTPGADRIFEVLVNATVTVEGLTVRHGRVSSMGGGINNHGNLTLNGVHVVENTAASGFQIGHGGGLFNDGILTITASRIAGNRALGGEASYGEGGGIRNDGTLTLTQSVIADNSTSDDNDTGFGGGLRNTGVAHLTECTISGNSTSLGGDGGGIYNLGELTLHTCTVTQNRALRGAGIAHDGSALTIDASSLTHNATYAENNGGGGALYTTGGATTITQSALAENAAGGSGGGIEYYCGYQREGALIIEESVIRNNQATTSGGGLIYSSDEESGRCSLALRKTLVEGNQAMDGGGLRILRPRVTISDSTLRNNIATQDGGGLMARISDGYIDMTVLRTTISGNQAGTSGGGVYIASPDQTFDMQFINSTISGNTVISGTGGGFYLGESNDSLRIALINSTVTANGAAQGAGVHVFHQDSSFEMTGTLRLTNSLIADNLGSDCGGETADNVPFSGQRVTSFGHNLDSDGTCLPEGVRQPSDLPNGNANLGPLADHGGATFTHALLAGSQALDAGDDAVCASEPVAGIDQRGVTRPQGAHCDIGAYEAAVQPVTTDLLFVSSRSSATAGGVPFRDEDILAYEFNTNTWQMIFDGSDVGITKDVDAFAFRPDGTLFLSFNGPTVVPGLGAVDDSDIVLFTPTQLGSDTAGSFAWFLHGAAVGLTTDGEDIDAIGITAAGTIVISTIGDFNTPTLAGKDEDLIQLDDPSSSAWSLFLDGSAVGLANEDVNGFWLDIATGERYLTVKDSFAFADGQATVQIDSDDIFICIPTQAGCAYRRFWDSDAHDYSAENLDSFGLGALPASFVAGGQGRDDLSSTLDEAAADDDIDDFNVEELINQQFVPWVASGQ